MRTDPCPATERPRPAARFRRTARLRRTVRLRRGSPIPRSIAMAPGRPVGSDPPGRAVRSRRQRSAPRWSPRPSEPLLAGMPAARPGHPLRCGRCHRPAARCRPPPSHDCRGRHCHHCHHCHRLGGRRCPGRRCPGRRHHRVRCRPGRRRGRDPCRLARGEAGSRGTRHRMMPPGSAPRVSDVAAPAVTRGRRAPGTGPPQVARIRGRPGPSPRPRRTCQAGHVPKRGVWTAPAGTSRVRSRAVGGPCRPEHRTVRCRIVRCRIVRCRTTECRTVPCTMPERPTVRWLVGRLRVLE